MVYTSQYNFNCLVSITAGGPECPRGQRHRWPSSTVDFGWFVAYWEHQKISVLQRFKFKICGFNYTRHCGLKLTWTVIYYCKWQPYFFSIEPLSKTGYWLGVCHGWFHLQGITGGEKNTSRVRITKLKILVHSGIRTGDLPFTKRARYHWATKADVGLAGKTSLSFTCTIFRNLPVARVRCSKIICCLFLSYDICIVLLFTN